MDSFSDFGMTHMEFVVERLAAGQQIRYLNFRGISMLPMLRQGKDAVELSPLPEKLKKYDLPVYRRRDGQFVMHRIVDVKSDHYICLGDNTYAYETVYPGQMVGIVSAFKRGEKRIEVDHPVYRLYCRFWKLIYPLRSGIRFAKAAAKGMIKRIIKGR